MDHRPDRAHRGIAREPREQPDHAGLGDLGVAVQQQHEVGVAAERAGDAEIVAAAIAAIDLAGDERARRQHGAEGLARAFRRFIVDHDQLGLERAPAAHRFDGTKRSLLIPPIDKDDGQTH